MMHYDQWIINSLTYLISRKCVGHTTFLWQTSENWRWPQQYISHSTWSYNMMLLFFYWVVAVYVLSPWIRTNLCNCLDKQVVVEVSLSSERQYGFHLVLPVFSSLHLLLEPSLHVVRKPKPHSDATHKNSSW